MEWTHMPGSCRAATAISMRRRKTEGRTVAITVRCFGSVPAATRIFTSLSATEHSGRTFGIQCEPTLSHETKSGRRSRRLYRVLEGKHAEVGQKTMSEQNHLAPGSSP